MTIEWLVLNAVVIVAAGLQALTGIGFGVLAGPIMLMVLDSGSALQISIVLNLLIAVVLVPFVRKRVDRRLLVDLSWGTLAGVPIGVAVFGLIGIVPLKLLAGAAVALTIILLVRGNRGTQGDGGSTAVSRIALGTASGAMCGSLAMPGPIVAAWMGARDYDSLTVRATILALFILSYSLALLLQGVSAEIPFETLELALSLAPATLLGIAAGSNLQKYRSENVMRRLVILILGATAITLFCDALVKLSS